MFYEVKIAGHAVRFSFRIADPLKYTNDGTVFNEYRNGSAITIPEVIVDRYMKMYACSYGYSEYMNALYMASNYLLQYNICSFHSVAIRVHGKGYLISGESGVGKTTQYLNLKKLYDKSIEIINGDKPFLEFKEGNKVMIHSSVWKGKEDFGSNSTCELAGIIFLRQAGENVIRRADPSSLVVTSLSQFLYHPDCEDTVRKVCELDRRLLSNVPLWIFKNTGNTESSELLYKTVLSGGYKNDRV